MIRLVLLILAILANVSALEILGVDYSEPDKQGHLLLGGFSAGLGIMTLDMIKPDAPWYARFGTGLATATVVAFAKEYADSFDPLHHTVDRDDAVATITGGFVVAAGWCWRF